MQRRTQEWGRIVVVMMVGLLGWMWGCRTDAEGPAAAPPATAASAPAATTNAATNQALRRAHVWVKGRVQGVGFRAFTQENARLLSVQGWVTNLRDGRVEAVLEGPPNLVDLLLTKIRSGPPNARVDDVEVKEEKATGEFKGFETKP